MTMTRPALLLVLLLVLPLSAHSHAPSPSPPDLAPLLDIQPDPSKTVRLTRWANAEEFDRFHSVRGMPRRKVIQTLGHPWQIDKRPDGTEVWRYDWGVDWRLSFTGGVCTWTHSNDGW
jgi:hypothetical protein